MNIKNLSISIAINTVLFFIVPYIFYMQTNKNVESSLATLAGVILSIWIMIIRKDWNKKKKAGFFISTILVIAILGTIAVFPVAMLIGDFKAIGMVGYAVAGFIYMVYQSYKSLNAGEKNE